MKAKKKIKEKISQANLLKLPLFYRVMEEAPLQYLLIRTYNAKRNTFFFLESSYYKPISKIIDIDED